MARSSAVRSLSAVASSAVVLAVPAVAEGADPRCAGSDLAPAPETLARSAVAVACEINLERATRGLRQLSAEPRLATAAVRHTRHMVRRRYFSHVAPGGRTMTDRLRRAGYVPDDTPWAVGETLAWGTDRLSTPASVVAAWMHSPAHRRVLLARRYRELGVGVTIGTPLAQPRGTGATYAAELGVVGP